MALRDKSAGRGGRYRFGVTMGDPAGVGPELLLHLLATPAAWQPLQPVVYGSSQILREVADRSGLPWPPSTEIAIVAEGTSWHELAAEESPILFETALPERVKPGLVQAHCGQLAYRWIAAAAADALQGATVGIVTAPISKAALQAGNIDFPGHTEMLAALSGVAEPRMFFWSREVAVGLVTIHIPLAAVTPAITREAVVETIRQVAGAMRSQELPQPRIGVLGVNPHAGEGGLFGSSERTAIAPAVAEARAAGIDAIGPLVPDVAFRETMRREIDAYVAMYHDQGLIPFKMIAFDSGVNVTLGLPFIRTSPDHGTAFDIAWQGRALPGSFFAAIDYLRQRLG